MQNDTKPARSGLATMTMIGLGVVVVVLAVVYVVRSQDGDNAATRENDPGKRATERVTEKHVDFQNARTDVGYVGSARCMECHADDVQDCGKGHSNSFGVVDPAEESLPGACAHERTELEYRLLLKDGAMRVQEVLPMPKGPAVTLMDKIVRYRVGSGRRQRVYLTETDGFVHETPTRWDATKKTWIVPGGGASGFVPPSFARPVGEQCISCHVGRVEGLDGAVQRWTIHEETIGCERCHGPGELHDDLHSKGKVEIDGPDLTIANPKHMSRRQKMDVCAQCHMDPAVTVVNVGKRASDWRPGMRWSDVQVTYRMVPDDPRGEQVPVGHVDSMRRSACYQKSDSLTCLTCHNPHKRPPADEAERRTWFNSRCLTCHQHCARVPDEGPGIVPPETDDCVKCHMPGRDVPEAHVSAVDHRITIPGIVWPAGGKQPKLELAPIDDTSALSFTEQDRSLAIGHLLAVGRYRLKANDYDHFRTKCEELTKSALDGGLRDPVLLAARARNYLSRGDRDAAVQMLEEASKTGEGLKALRPDRHAEALHFLAEKYVAEARYEDATKLLDDLRGMRRDAADDLLRAEMLRVQKLWTEASAAARRALSIWPSNPEVQYRAAEVFGEAGDEEAMKRHNARGVELHKRLGRRRK